MIICLWISVWSKSFGIWSKEGQRVWGKILGTGGRLAYSTLFGGQPVVDNTVYVYYGAADRVIGLATCALDELLEWVK